MTTYFFHKYDVPLESKPVSSVFSHAILMNFSKLTGRDGFGFFLIGNHPQTLVHPFRPTEIPTTCEPQKE